MKVIREDEYIDAVENDMGWCTSCEEFTAEGVEPDAEEYTCPCCAERTVMGAEQALLSGEISFGEEETDPDSPINYRIPE